MDQEEKSSWQYKPDDSADSKTGSSEPNEAAKTSPRHRPKSLSWEAPEYIEHPHGAGWFFMLTLGTLMLATLAYLIAKDPFATIVIVLVGIIVGIFATQKPKTANYEISDAGISINGKLYSYSNYKSFAVIREGALSSINLFPLKRLMPPLSAYFEPKQEKEIVDVLGEYLPFEDRKLDGIDRLARRLRL